jgi:hypothetical protein
MRWALADEARRRRESRGGAERLLKSDGITRLSSESADLEGWVKYRENSDDDGSLCVLFTSSLKLPCYDRLSVVSSEPDHT